MPTTAAPHPWGGCSKVGGWEGRRERKRVRDKVRELAKCILGRKLFQLPPAPPLESPQAAGVQRKGCAVSNLPFLAAK